MDSLINRFSSRRQPLDKAFLAERLRAAKSYKRIAGYFRSSLFELVGEEIGNIPDVRIVCNSDLDPNDVAISKAAARETALKEQWNSVSPGVEALLRRGQYRKLYDLLSSGKVQVRVVPKNETFLHGKAGVIEGPDGKKTCFLGSINETRSAFTKNYEILWEDTSPEGVRWVEEEFEALWEHAYPLPEAIVEEVKRVADRVEVHFQDLKDQDLPAAVFAEAPIYRGGEQLQPWQRSFVTKFLQDRETYGKTRLLLADDVGLGKTLSLAASAIVGALLGDGPVLILCPSTLTIQWQVEIKDRLGVPSAVWDQSKVWVDPDGHAISGQGIEYVTRCPYQVGIVSTGLVIHGSPEADLLLQQKYGTIILDEAHRARRKGGLGETQGEYTNLLQFMARAGDRTKHLLLGTATPTQTEVYELWDLLKVLNGGADFVLGREYVSIWANWEKALPFVKGDARPSSEREAWELARNPLPPACENVNFAGLRERMGLPDNVFFSSDPFSSLDCMAQETVRQMMAPGFFKDNNPIVRHTVLRRRSTLEDLGLLDKIGVNIHPDPALGPAGYPGQSFEGQALLTNHPFDLAYEAAEAFSESLGRRLNAAGFIKSLLLQRICSSFASGKATAQRMLDKRPLEDDEDAALLSNAFDGITPTEASYLRTIIAELSRPEARDPKLSAVKYFLTEHKVEGKTWLEHGCIIFSQYFDTADWVTSELAKFLPDELIAIYAGAGKSRLYRNTDSTPVSRETIKKAVKAREIRLVVATDAASEGLNLQALGTLINVDLPWNPSRLEQRLGRIKRIGQVRSLVDMLNLVYRDTRDQKVYQVLSKRFKDRYDIFGSLPDVIDTKWIDSIEELEKKMDEYIHLRRKTQNAFDLRYQTDIKPDENRWETCSRVLARSDIIQRLAKPW